MRIVIVLNKLVILNCLCNKNSLKKIENEYEVVVYFICA